MNAHLDAVEQFYAEICDRRVADPTLPHRVAATRRRRPQLTLDGRLFIIAADPAARGVLKMGDNPVGLADRPNLIANLLEALSEPGLDGILATADIIDDLFIAEGIRRERGFPSLLDDRVLVGSMNRGGLADAVYDLEETMTGYDVEGIARYGLDAAKVMLRLSLDDPASGRTLFELSRLTEQCVARDIPMFFETFPVHGGPGDLPPRMSLDKIDAMRAVSVASGVASSSAMTWIKIPHFPDLAEVARATTCPIVLLGGESGQRPFHELLAEGIAAAPNVRGCMVGRRMLYPPDGDVRGAVRAVAEVLHGDG